MLLRYIAEWFLALTFLEFGASPALADFRVCNATQRTVGVAVGYRTASSWISEGWWQIDPTSCKTLIEGPLSSRFYYLYAEDSSGIGRWDGIVNMCVSENEFKINGVKNCFTRGFQKFGFREIDTKNQISWMVQLIETVPPSSPLNNPIVTGTVKP
ncbi:MAG: hypothetical protein JSC189_001339 [Candidatus Tokpelaia sp. JSC189]|nr:MAG: hypothetical protein JSC189_001339 [Candidatus Tokpelaia sp. JSC189]